jgi:TolB-like protein/DNA-binding winged helix-turn-helix (wHTH) protein/tetratricopeptide (TPR) repeat protein
MDSQARPRYRFGVFELDLGRDELRRAGLRVKLRGQPLEILALLLEKPGEIVSRESLRERLWPADTFVDFDHGLNSSINRLREALGDVADNPRFVETVPRRGYRFIAPVEREDAARQAAGAPPPSLPPAPEPRRRPAWKRVAAWGALVVLLLGLAFAGSRVWRPAGEQDPLRLAVLPFQSLSPDPGQEYLADGMTDALITDLSQLHSLRVLSRTTVMAYKGKPKSLSDIARELRLDVAVEGSVLQSGQRARINAQLVDTARDRSLWARSYDCELGDLIDVQRRVAREITESVQVTVSDSERQMLERSSRVSPEAFEAYVRGRLLRDQLTDDALVGSRDAFERATRLAPDYAPAWAALADVHWITGAAGYDSVDPRESSSLARAAARRALQLDPDEPLAHGTLAMIAFQYDWDWEEAEAQLRKALALRPSFALVHNWYSGFLTAMSRFDEAIAEARRSEELDPLSRRAALTVGIRYYYARRYAEAERDLRRVVEGDPSAFAARLSLGLVRLQQGAREEGQAELARAVGDASGNAWALGSLGYAYGVSGRAADARGVLAKLDRIAESRHVSPFSRALVFVGLGVRDEALDALNQAYVERSGWMPFLKVEPMLDPLRGDPAFQDLVTRVWHRSTPDQGPVH